MKHISTYFYENDLVINLKKNKTEGMLFGTSKRLFKAKDLEIFHEHTQISTSERYKYLGSTLDQTLSLN